MNTKGLKTELKALSNRINTIKDKTSLKDIYGVNFLHVILKYKRETYEKANFEVVSQYFYDCELVLYTRIDIIKDIDIIIDTLEKITYHKQKILTFVIPPVETGALKYFLNKYSKESFIKKFQSSKGKEFIIECEPNFWKL